MNIYTQACGLFITFLLVLFYFRQPTLGLKSEISFRHLLYVVFFCIILDILSVATITYSDELPTLLVVAIAKLYLASLCSVAYFSLYYTVTDVYENIHGESAKLVSLLMKISYAVIVAFILRLPIEVYNDGEALYTYGAACNATYIGSVIYIVWVLIEVFGHRKYIKATRRRAVLIWTAIWIIAAVLQFLIPKLLIVGFAACAGVFIIFFEMENPEASISRRTGHFSSAVIRDYIDYQYKNHKDFSAMLISFTTVADSSHDTLMLEVVIKKLSDFLFSLSNTCKIFDTTEGYFLLIFKNKEDIDFAKLKVEKFFENITEDDEIASAITLMHPFFTIIPDSYIATKSDELLAIINDFLPNAHRQYEENYIVVNSSVMMSLRDKKKIEDQVIDAINNDRVEVYFQPIYNLKTKTFTSAEALVRIRLADSTMLSPAIFIPIVEETGRIIALSDAIYRRALSFMKLYHLERLGIEYIELNLSVRQGESPVFAERFAEMLEEYSILPQMINLEITETSSLNSRECMLSNLYRLQEVGCSFSLDDFGSGSSNLNYIIEMPVKYVKLDRELIMSYFHNERARAIITAVVEMAHSIDIKIIAEGVETIEMLDEMRALGVDLIQGYYFSQALPEREFLSFIQKNNLM